MSARRILNIAANSMLGIAALILVAFAANRISFTDHETKAYLANDGKSLVLSNVDLSKSSVTVLLALRTTCRYCEKQTPFYRQLLSQAQAKNVSVIALFQEELPSARDYLRSEQLDIPNVLRVRLRTLGIAETPTLLVVNPQGDILSKWVGVLPPSTESYILDMLGEDEETIRRTAPLFASLGPAPPTMLVGDLKRMVDNREAVTVLDIDNRQAFAGGHLAAAKNIPSDEILMRALNEVPANNSVVLFSRSGTSPAMINSARAALEQAGFTNVSWLNVTLERCKQAGLMVVEERLTQ